MKYGQAFTPDGPLTLGDLRHIATNVIGSDDQIVEVFTPLSPDRRRVTLTVTDQRHTPPLNSAAPQQDTTEGETQHG